MCSLGDDRVDLPIIEGKTDDSTLLLPTDLAKVTEEGKKVKEKEEESSMVAVVEGIQPLPKKVVKKIDACEYVDFSDLLQDQFLAEELNLPSSHSGVVLVQSLDSLKKKKRVGDFQAWIEALLVYAAVKCRDALPELANIMAYGVIMGQTARDHPADRWLTYDRKVRETAGAKKDLRWNSGLCFSGPVKFPMARTCSSCMASGHTSWECPNAGIRQSFSKKRPLQPPPALDQKHMMCFPFNNRGECDRGKECHFIHKCISCGEDHPQLHCRAKRRGN